jgi:HlyD family secretion protein
MPPNQATPVAALRRLASSPPDAEPDEDLLRRFCADRDKAAFAVIVRRHGGLVLDVCRTVLRNDADAEDAFQATFVALAADARRVRCPAALAGWLHAVACRTAGKARRARDRRRAREARVPARPDAPAPDPSWAEVRQAVHEEVNRLPDRYRAAVVLFYLAGRTQDEVGRALGLSTAGAKKRLERGRALLRSALDGRGFGPTVALAAAAITLPGPVAALSTDAAELAVRFVTNPATVPTAVLSLLSSGVRPMSAKIAFGAAALMGVATTVGLGVLRGGPADQPGRPDDPPAAAQAKPPEGAGQPDRKRPVPRAAAGGESRGDSSSRLAAELERFRALGPAERLKLVEKLAGVDVPFAATTRGDLAAAVVERGSIEPASYADVICKVKAKDKESPATTIKWVIDEGSLVKKGNPLVLLDDSAIREQLQAATVKAREAEAAMALASENVRLVQQEGEVEVRLTEIDVKLAAAELKDPPTGKSKDVLELKVDQAKLKVERARARAKAQLVRAEAEQRARAAARDLEARRLSNIEAELKQCVLTAPSDGLVVYHVPAASRFGGAAAVVVEGEPVREGQKLLRVADLKEFVIAIRVHEAMISTVRVGQTAQVRVDAFPGKLLRGKVTQVSPFASASDWKASDIKVYPVMVAIEDAPPGLKPSMTGEAHVATGERTAVLQVPLKAVVSAGKDRVCFVKSGQELLERKVVTGASNASAIEIKEGLKEGDLVVTDPPALLVRP